MAKKGKAPFRGAQDRQGPNLDVGESKKRIRDYEDVADSDDEFHINRDKVLLGEEPEAKRRRKWQEQEEFLQPSDEEVLSYSEQEEDEEEDTRDDVAPLQRQGEVTSDSEASENEEEDGIGWGTTKADLYGADAIETEEQALEEEAEGLRLQKKQLQAMNAADYGFDESDWQDTSKNGIENDADDAHVTEVLPQQQLQISDKLSDAERLKLLKLQYPEFDPLGRELLQLRETHAALLKSAQGLENDHLSQSAPNAILKLRAASAYLGTLTMYFALLTSPACSGSAKVVAMSATKLRSHPVMNQLVACRDTWQRIRDIPIDSPSSGRVARNVPDDILTDKSDLRAQPLALQKELSTSTQKKSRAQTHADAAQIAAEARRIERMERTEADLAELDALVATNKSSKGKRRTNDVANEADSDVGEEAPLTTREAAEKAQRKKSLRFYTSQIAQKASKRGSAGRNAGGDDDVPHRERLRDRQARLNAEAEKRGKKRDTDPSTELGGDLDEDDIRQAQAVRQDVDEDDYYDVVAARTAKKKSDKAAFAEAQKQAALQGGQVVQEAVVGPDGKRKISYLIEKNKGLTPHRKKDVRNPRVKKRKKYEEKKKKLASIKPVYKGGEGRGGYGGELTGIKKGLVKSTKL